MAESTERPVTQHVEVVGLDGKDTQAATRLDDIFGKIEAGKADGQTAEQVLNQPEIKQEVAEGSTQKTGTGSLVNPEVKKVTTAEPVKETKAEVKEEAKKEEKSGLDNALDKQEEVTRESLRKASEKKIETKDPTKAEEKKEEVKKEDEIPDDELKPLPHDGPRATKRILALLKKSEDAQAEVATTKKELQARDDKLKELQDQLGKVQTVDPKVQESIKGQLDELSMLRRRYQLDNDPEVKSKFDSRIDGAEIQISSLLKDKGAGEGLLNLIKEEGGWAKFASSPRIVELNDGKKVTAAELAEIVSRNLPYDARKTLDAAATEQVQIRREKDRFFKEEQEKANQYFEDQGKKTKAQIDEQNKKFQEIDALIKETVKDVEANADWLKQKPIPEGASKEEKADIQELNTHRKNLNVLFKKSLNCKDPKEAIEVVKDSVRYYDVQFQNQKLQDQIDSLKKELEAKSGEIAKFKTAGRTVVRGGSISTASPTTSAPKKPATLEDAFAQLERGEVLTTND